MRILFSTLLAVTCLTFSARAGTQSNLPNFVIILTDDQGYGIWPVLAEKAASPHQACFYHQGEELKAVRSGKWKLYVVQGKAGKLFNLDADIGEQNDVLGGNPEVAERLLALTKSFNDDLAKNSRPAGFLKNPKPLTK